MTNEKQKQSHKIELEKELINFKTNTFKILEQNRDLIISLEQELEHLAEIKDEHAKLKKELETIKKENSALKIENKKLKDLKAYKITKEYWKFRKKITMG